MPNRIVVLTLMTIPPAVAGPPAGRRQNVACGARGRRGREVGISVSVGDGLDVKYSRTKPRGGDAQKPPEPFIFWDLYLIHSPFVLLLKSLLFCFFYFNFFFCFLKPTFSSISLPPSSRPHPLHTASVASSPAPRFAAAVDPTGSPWLNNRLKSGACFGGFL